jgi:hypothetical protein
MVGEIRWRQAGGNLSSAKRKDGQSQLMVKTKLE